MGEWPRGWWENESKKDELLMPRLMPVTPIPRESVPTEALPGLPCPMLSNTVKERR